MNNSASGYVVAFDGPDGVGKTTQVQLAVKYLEGLGRSVHATRASGGTPIGEKLRAVSLANTDRPPEVDLYISLAMHTALGFDLQKRKQAGQICLVDRSPLAILAYNTIASNLQEKQLGYEACERMLRLWPLDLLITFTARQEVIDARRETRAKTDTAQSNNYFENKDSQYRRRVQEGYEIGAKLVREHPEWGTTLVEIDAESTVEDIQEQIRKQLQIL